MVIGHRCRVAAGHRRSPTGGIGANWLLAASREGSSRAGTGVGMPMAAPRITQVRKVVKEAGGTAESRRGRFGDLDVVAGKAAG